MGRGGGISQARNLKKSRISSSLLFGGLCLEDCNGYHRPANDSAMIAEQGDCDLFIGECRTAIFLARRTP